MFPAGLIGSYAVNVFLNLLAKLFVLIAPSHLLMGTSMFAVGRTWFTSMLVGAAFRPLRENTPHRVPEL